MVRHVSKIHATAVRYQDTAGCRTKFFGRSAGWLSAVSRISNPQTFGQAGGVENPAPGRLEIGDTADWEICAAKNFVLRPTALRPQPAIARVSGFV